MTLNFEVGGGAKHYLHHERWKGRGGSTVNPSPIMKNWVRSEDHTFDCCPKAVCIWRKLSWDEEMTRLAELLWARQFLVYFFVKRN